MAAKFDFAFVQSVVEHMNLDHADAVRNCILAFAPDLRAQKPEEADIAEALMIDIDAEGFETEITLESGEVQRRIITYAMAGLPAELEGPDQVRSALVTMAKKARAMLSDGSSA